MGGQRRFAMARCRECGLHEELCICDQRPRLELRTKLLVVQNNKERNKPTNTGRMIPQVLSHAELIYFGARGVPWDGGPLVRPDHDYVLVFPRVEDPEGQAPKPAAVLDPERIASLKANSQSEPGRTLAVVILDGTWAQCARMSRRVPELAAMEAWGLPEGPASHWGVRVPSEPSRISSFEAAIRVVELFEGPEPAAQMQAHFDRMAAAMQFMKAKRPNPRVPNEWIEARQARFGY